MPRKRMLGVRVLKAASSSLRLKILVLLRNRGPLSYTEIMNRLKLRPSRDAGRFAYHLKTLLKIDLIEPDVETKKYRLTDLGRRLVEIAEEIEESALESKRMLVRTSRLSLEYFDRNKIAESLIREAGVPADLAQKIARETERRLLKLKTKYLTAPLIREFVNAILIERGLEDYRHKMTRLGLPVYDVTQLIKSMSISGSDVEAVHEAAGDAVLEEYALLNVLPRDIADAHISGTLNLNNLGCWILKPNEFMHDIRPFLQHGLSSASLNAMMIPRRPPKSFRAALSMIVEMLRLASRELSGEQAIDYFNVFLAPFIKGLRIEEIEENIRLFITDINHTIPSGVSIGLELTLPPFLSKLEAINPFRDKSDKYIDYLDEINLIASLMIKVMLEDVNGKPIFNPSLIIKVRDKALKDGEAEDLLHQAHELAIRKGTPYFANLIPKEQMYASYTATGFRLASEWTGDWELDTLRTGNVDSVIINLPRALYDANGDKGRFFENIEDRLEMAVRALEIKYLTIKQRAREGLLPFLTQKINGDPYYRIRNSLRLISFVGLNETVQSLSGKPIYQDEDALRLAEEIITFISKGIANYIRKPETRINLSMIPCSDVARRLAELDLERYGRSWVKVCEDQEGFFYTNMTVNPPNINLPLKKYLSIEEKFHKLAPGSHLAKIPIKDAGDNSESLLKMTKEIVNSYNIGLYVYDKEITYCSNCRKIFNNGFSKCPNCGSVNSLTRFVRKPAKYFIKS